MDFLFKQFFALCNNPKFLESLLSSNVIWSIQVRFSSTKTPRNFIDEDFLFHYYLFLNWEVEVEGYPYHVVCEKV